MNEQKLTFFQFFGICLVVSLIWGCFDKQQKTREQHRRETEKAIQSYMERNPYERLR